MLPWRSSSPCLRSFQLEDRPITAAWAITSAAAAGFIAALWCWLRAASLPPAAVAVVPLSDGVAPQQDTDGDCGSGGEAPQPRECEECGCGGGGGSGASWWWQRHAALVWPAALVCGVVTAALAAHLLLGCCVRHVIQLPHDDHCDDAAADLCWSPPLPTRTTTRATAARWLCAARTASPTSAAIGDPPDAADENMANSPDAADETFGVPPDGTDEAIGVPPDGSNTALCGDAAQIAE